MEKIWSPWRSKYIESFKNENSEKGCVFCDSLKNPSNENSLIIYQDKATFIILNLYPYNNGHLMVVPKRHLSDFSELTIHEHAEIMKNIDLSIKALKIVLQPHGFNIGANLGRVAGAGIDTHLHFHIVPRWNGDTNFMPVLGEIKVISQDLLKTKNSLIDAIKSLI